MPLLEYACTFLPCNQAAIVSEISEGRKIPEDLAKAGGLQLHVGPISTIARRLARQ